MIMCNRNIVKCSSLRRIELKSAVEQVQWPPLNCHKVKKIKYLNIYQDMIIGAILMMKETFLFSLFLLQGCWDSSSTPSASCPSSQWRRWGLPVTSLCSASLWPTSVWTSTDLQPRTQATSGMKVSSLNLLRTLSLCHRSEPHAFTKKKKKRLSSMTWSLILANG